MKTTGWMTTLALLLPLAAARDRMGLRARKPQNLLLEKDRLADLAKRADNGTATMGSTNTTMRYRSNMTDQYFVESLPDFPFDLGELYSGNIPIDYSNSSESLFFFFQPTVGEPVDEITIWLNGGPGCSSLEGFLQENGLFTWQPGTALPVINQYSWVNLTNMLWVEQPIGTGFAQGTPKATTQEETAQDFIKFFKNFQKEFGIENYKIYVTGESYAGRYVPYISAAMLDANDTQYYNLSGALMYDPVIGEFDFTQSEIPAYPFVVDHADMFSFNASFMAELEMLHHNCGYAEYIEQHYQFPPSGNQPPLFLNYSDPRNASCDIAGLVNQAALQNNPCFDVYEVNLMCPLLSDVLGFPTGLVQNQYNNSVYFDRADVKQAIHAPAGITWAECANEPVYVGGNAGPESEGDTSSDPIQRVLPQVIEATNRVLVANGDYDLIILTNGTLLAIQNMTWNGDLGFQSKPNTSIEIALPDLQYADLFAENGQEGYDGPGQGIMGIQHYERGLMWAETFQSGHMQPQYQPRSTYRHLQWLLRRIDEL